MKVSSLYTSKLEHINLMKKSNVSLTYFPDFNREKIINQNNKYLIIWDLNKESIILTKETDQSHNLTFIDRNDRNKNYSSIVFNKSKYIFSSNIHYKNKEWKLKDGKKLRVKDHILEEVEEITFMMKLEEYSSTLRDRLILGFSNGNVAIFKFNSGVCINKIKAHKKKVNDIVHLNEYNYNYFATCSDNFTVKVWDFSNNSLVNELKGHYNKVVKLHYLKYMNPQYIASCSSDSRTIIWNFVKRERLYIMNNESGITKSLYLYDYMPATIINSDKKNSITIWKYNIQNLDSSAASVSFKELKYFGNSKLEEKLKQSKFLEEVRDGKIGVNNEDQFGESVNKIKSDMKNYEILKEFDESEKKKFEKLADDFLKQFKRLEKNKKEKEISFHNYKNSLYVDNLSNNIQIEDNNIQGTTNCDSKYNLTRQKEYANLIYKLINLNTSINSFPQIISVIEKVSSLEKTNHSNDRSYLNSIRIFDNCKSSVFPVKENFKILQNLVNSNHYVKYLNITIIDRIYTFMDFILSVEKMYYEDKKFFKLEKENIFIDLKTKNVKIISFYLHFEKNFDWDIKFNNMINNNSKEEFLKCFFIDFMKFYFNNGNMKIEMDEDNFSFEEEHSVKEFLWKNKHTFIFKMVKKYLSNFLKSSKKSSIFEYKNNYSHSMKQLSSLEKVKNLLIYFYSNSPKNKNENEIANVNMVKIFKKEDKNIVKEKSKKVIILFIKSLKFTVYAFDEIVVYDEYFKQLQKKNFEKDRDKVKCLLFYKEKENLITGTDPAKVVFYDLKKLEEIKVIQFKSGGTINDLVQLKGYKDRNDIFVGNLDDTTIYVFDYQGNFLKVLNDPKLNGLKHLAYIPSFNILSIVTTTQDKKQSELMFVDMNTNNINKKCNIEGEVNNFQIVNNFLGDDTFIFNTTKKVFLYKIKDILKISSPTTLTDFNDKIDEKMEILKVTCLKNIGRNYLMFNGLNTKLISLYKISLKEDNSTYQFNLLYKFLPKDDLDPSFNPNMIYTLTYLSNFDKLTLAFSSDNSYLDIYETNITIARNQASEMKRIRKLSISDSDDLGPNDSEKADNESKQIFEIDDKIAVRQEIRRIKKKYWLMKTNETDTEIVNVTNNQTKKTNLPNKHTVQQEIKKIKKSYWLLKTNQTVVETTSQKVDTVIKENTSQSVDTVIKTVLPDKSKIEKEIQRIKKSYWLIKTNQTDEEKALTNQETNLTNVEVKLPIEDKKKEIIDRVTVDEKILQEKKLYWEKKLKP